MRLEEQPCPHRIIAGSIARSEKVTLLVIREIETSEAVRRVDACDAARVSAVRGKGRGGVAGIESAPVGGVGAGGNAGTEDVVGRAGLVVS